MKPKIVFLDEYSLAGRDLSAVKALGDYTGYDMTAPDEVAVRCADAEIVVTNKVRLDAAMIAQLPHLRLICVAATGVNNIDLDAAAEHGVEVRNAAGYSTHSVAETTLGAAIALLRESVYYDEFFKSGRYARSPRLFCFDRPIRQLHGRRWGVIGLGAIGREVARLAAAFGCEVSYHSTSGVAREEAYPALPLDELLAWADVVSIHCPLNAHTRGLIGAEQLRRMKPSALLVNVARGGIVDEAALAEALDDGRIAGAALDVFSSEPVKADNPLLALRDPYRLLASPHNAWATGRSDRHARALRRPQHRSIPEKITLSTTDGKRPDRKSIRTLPVAGSSSAYLQAFNPRITAAENPACSISFRPRTVIPPGVVTRSISVSGCSPRCNSSSAAPRSVAATICVACPAGQPSSTPPSTDART